jgi:membrane fusion protein, multidrug efflux system
MDDLKLKEPLLERTRPSSPLEPSRRPSLRRLRWGVVILLPIAALLCWIQKRPAQQPRGGRFAITAPMPVVDAAAQKGDIRIADDELGTGTALATVTAQTQIASQLTEVAFQEGQEIKKGDFLAQIDSRPYQAALDQAEGTLQRDQGALAEARMDLSRYQKLSVQNSIARQQAEDQFYVVQHDEGTVQLDQAAVDTPSSISAIAASFLR